MALATSAKALELPRGFRNNNPGNIRKSKDPWQGLAPLQPDREFASFVSPVMGIRALAVVLRTYFERYNLDTIAEIINRWAPPKNHAGEFENNTGSYVAAVAKSMGRKANERLDLFQYADLAPLVRAIIAHELGNPKKYGRREWYSQDIIDEALRRMGVARPQQAIVKDAQATGTAAAVGGTAITGTAAYVELRQMGAELREQGKVSEASGVMMAGMALTLTALGVLAFTVWKKRKRKAQ